MSESLFMKQQIEAFVAAHPSEDGWKVYEYPLDLAKKLYVPYLLDCLRDWHPEALKRRSALKEVREGDLLGTAGDSHYAESGTEWDLQKELDSYWWKGLVELEWKGSPLHYLTYPVNTGMAFGDFFFVATKSNAVLQDFQRVLDAYGKARRKKPDSKQILVVNGDDIPVQEVTWDDVVMEPTFAEDIRRNVSAFFESRGKYEALGIPYRRGFLFAGPPGCGKTLTIKTLAYTTPAKFITVLGRADVKDYQIEEAMYLAGNYSPAVVLFEDLDKLIASKEISLSHFLNILDGFKVTNGVLVIATSNEPARLDPALLHRPSRFDRVWKFTLPKQEQRFALLRKRGGAYFSEAALEEVARKSDGFSMAYVQEIVVNALLDSAHNGNSPDDQTLLKSLTTLKAQRKAVSKDDDELADRESVGFCVKEN
jgi:AAA+ superfamily predicted ATPase